MKKILAAALLAVSLFTVQAQARDDDAKVRGIIGAVDTAQSSFTVNAFDGKNYTFFVNEGTKIEKDHDFWYDQKLTLDELKAGDKVKVEFYTTNPEKIFAKEVDVK